jgi:hypothetical protein
MRCPEDYSVPVARQLQSHVRPHRPNCVRDGEGLFGASHFLSEYRHMTLDPIATFNRLLISNPGFYRQFDNDTFSMWVYDRSSLPFLVEEFVASAAVEVAIPAGSITAASLTQLSPVLRERVRLVDEDGAIRREMDALLTSVYSDLELDPVRGGYGVRPANQGQGRTAWQSANATNAVREELYDFLLGLHLKLEVGLNFSRLMRAVEFLRTRAQSPNSRACLAVLAGVGRLYRPVEQPTIRLVAGSTDEQVERFRMFAEDEAYRHLSEQTTGLAIPERSRRALQLITRSVRAVLRRPRLAGIAKAGSRGISAVTHLPTPDLDLIEPLFGRTYFPPILEMRDVYRRAHASWRQSPAKRVVDALIDAGMKEDDRDFLLYVETYKGRPWSENPRHVQPRRISKGTTLMLTSGRNQPGRLRDEL